MESAENLVAKQLLNSELVTAKWMLRKGHQSAGWSYVEFDQEKTLHSKGDCGILRPGLAWAL